MEKIINSIIEEGQNSTFLIDDDPSGIIFSVTLKNRLLYVSATYGAASIELQAIDTSKKAIEFIKKSKEVINGINAIAHPSI